MSAVFYVVQDNGLMLSRGGAGGDGQFDSSYGVAVDAEGNVYVADSGNHRIQKFRGGQWPVVVLLLRGRRLTK